MTTVSKVSANRRHCAYTPTCRTSSSGAVPSRHATRISRYATWLIGKRRSIAGDLRAALDLRAAVRAQRRDRRPRQRLVVAVQPVDDLLVLEAGVAQHRDDRRQRLDDGALLQEQRRHRTRAVVDA